MNGTTAQVLGTYLIDSHSRPNNQIRSGLSLTNTKWRRQDLDVGAGIGPNTATQYMQKRQRQRNSNRVPETNLLGQTLST